MTDYFFRQLKNKTLAIAISILAWILIGALLGVASFSHSGDIREWASIAYCSRTSPLSLEIAVAMFGALLFFSGTKPGWLNGGFQNFWTQARKVRKKYNLFGKFLVFTLGIAVGSVAIGSGLAIYIYEPNQSAIGLIFLGGYILLIGVFLYLAPLLFISLKIDFSKPKYRDSGPANSARVLFLLLGGWVAINLILGNIHKMAYLGHEQCLPLSEVGVKLLGYLLH